MKMLLNIIQVYLVWKIFIEEVIIWIIWIRCKLWRRCKTV